MDINPENAGLMFTFGFGTVFFCYLSGYVIGVAKRSINQI